MGQEQGLAARPSTRPSRRQQKGRVDGPGERSRRACASPPAACLSPQRSRKLHRHGRHARGGGQGGGGRARHPHGGGAARNARAAAGARGAQPRDGARDARLYAGAWHHPLRERIAALPGAVRRRRRSRARRGDDGLVGGVRTGVPRPVRCRCARRAAEPGLSLLPAHPDEPRLPPVEIETGPQTRWMPAQDQVAALAGVDGLDGLLSPAPPIRPARC